ncbi:hypothetical protein ES332_A13G139000v1 [Gossypium tomentosum]|uniref:Uncharacterized protein n=1 Tax=Gossypium tomentosum TaxID=34277 RepID=A0A5D2ML11_GOSTO|nr:hypothetical protein ES332_A13G139000v1 [Gossypium tomentosum]
MSILPAGEAYGRQRFILNFLNSAIHENLSNQGSIQINVCCYPGEPASSPAISIKVQVNHFPNGIPNYLDNFLLV